MKRLNKLAEFIVLGVVKSPLSCKIQLSLPPWYKVLLTLSKFKTSWGRYSNSHIKSLLSKQTNVSAYESLLGIR